MTRLSLVISFASAVALAGSSVPQVSFAAVASDEQQPFSQARLEQLAAPIALYPDALLTEILMASTYPLDVVQAARWRAANPKVSGTSLTAALQGVSWDDSVKGLTAVPAVLALMNEKLDWTEQLGEAFLAQPMGFSQRFRTCAVAQRQTGAWRPPKISV